MARPSIGLAIIAKNEAENLPRLFESFQGCFDEVHLTDTGSTDDTVATARSLGAIVHHFDWVHDFAAARNASFAPLTTDYTAWLDCDDVLENKEGFLLWRDTVMELADYHLVSYHYSSDAQGRAVCTFARERVFKRSLDLKWKYPIHEGVMPLPNIKMNYTHAWAVRHKRTEEDLKKDRSRNLGIFQKVKETGQMDPRLEYYYGKELFEAQRPMEAVPALLNSMKHAELELHDRILAIQYTCYAYMQCNQFERCVDMAHIGLQLCPQRAEFYGILGDAYLKMNRIQDAVPAFSAAANCKITGGPQQGSAIFHHEDAYTCYPRNQLSRIFANLGEFDRASDIAQGTWEKFDNSEAKAIFDEIQKVKSRNLGYHLARPCEDIVISCPPEGPYVWDANIAKQKAMGGSETAAIEMAQWLHKLSGRPVKVFNMREDVQVCDGVEYLPAKGVVDYFNVHQPWLHIAWRHNIKLTNAKTFVWSHDLFTQGGEVIENYDKILALTPFHKRFLMVNQGIPESKIHVTRNGIKPERFLDGPWGKDPWKFVFPSSPDRGLDRAMKVLDRVRVKYPEIKLHVFYGVSHLDKYGLKDLRILLERMMSERSDWVTYHGATQQDLLMKHFKSAAYWLHPCDFIETSCITASEITCAGVYPITRRLGGLMDTLALAENQGMATLIDSDCISDAQFQLYAGKTMEAIESQAYKRVKIDPVPLSWESVAQEWLRDLPNL